jgi:hypothetical protein
MGRVPHGRPPWMRRHRVILRALRLGNASHPPLRERLPTYTRKGHPLNLPDLAPKSALAALELASLRAQREIDLARSHPAYLLDSVARMVDEKTGESFQFGLTDPASPWYWQRKVLDGFLANLKTIVLKARQIGITWLACGLGLWIVLYKPGTLMLVYRQKEDDASELVKRIWQMYVNLPEHLRAGVRVLKPTRGSLPYLEIVFEHPDGRISKVRGMASTESAGHGETAALVLLDEGARIERLRGIWTAIQPTLGMVGRAIVISTGNGVSNQETGGGNYFHRLWVTALEKGLDKVFLSWKMHPERDDEWYVSSSEISSLDARERKEQYPSTPAEAFALPDAVWYDVEALDYYAAERVRGPLYRFDFVTGTRGLHSAKRSRSTHGAISVYVEPDPTHDYGLFADVATAQGFDKSAAYVVDFATMEFAAEFHGRIDEDLFAYQLHFLGRYYGTQAGCARDALLAVENQGGYGNAVLIPLRDGKEGRPFYRRLYRHRQDLRVELPLQSKLGYPMNSGNRPTTINQLGKALRERTLPFLSDALMEELGTFVRRETGTSPRALEGCNDDLVIAACGALELYRQHGAHPERPKPRSARKRAHHFLKLGNA